MKCPFCQHPNTQVTDSRWLEDTNSIRRRRKCLECGQRFSTFETVEMRMPQVIKSNGTRVPFNPHKLQTSLERALHKRPVTQEQIDETVALIEQRLYRLGKKKSLHASSAKWRWKSWQNRPSRLCPLRIRL